MCPTKSQIISPKLKRKVDRYVRFVNIVNVVLFAKTSIKSISISQHVGMCVACIQAMSK